MLKKTQTIELFRTINKTKVSFISVVLFIMLGMAIFLGIDWGNKGFEMTIEDTLNKGLMHDAEISYPYGFTEDFIEDLKKLDYVEAAEGLYRTEAFFKKDGLKYQVNITMLTSSVNTPVEIKGELPDSDSEIAVERQWAQTHGISIGDTIEFEKEEKTVRTLKNDSFVVTGLILSPQYIGLQKGSFGVSQTTGVSHDCVFFVSEKAFNESAYMGYSDIVLRSGLLREYTTFSDEYKTADKKLVRRLKLFVDDYTDIRNNKLPEGLKPYDCTILGRNSNAAVGSAAIPSDIMSKVKYTLSCLFVLVGLLVCYSAVSRIVFEQTRLIGTKRALGLSNRQIYASYLLYAAIAVAFGSATGAILARFAIEPVISQTLIKSYNVAEPVYYFGLIEATAFFLVEMIAILIFAYLACRNVLSRTVLKLLNGQNDTSGRRRWFEKYRPWKSLSLLVKTIINNSLNDKKRVFATVTGIAGSCALMVCAMTMIADINHTRDHHLNNITPYDTMAYINPNQPEAADDIGKYLSSKGIKYVSVFNSGATIKAEGEDVATEIMVFENNSFYNLFHIFTDDEKQSIDSGAWICKAFADNKNLHVGDRIEITDSAGESRILAIGGVFDYYLPKDLIIMKADYYEKAFDKTYDANAVMLKRNNQDIKKLNRDLENTDGFISAFDIKGANADLLNSILSAILTVASTFIVLSVVLALVVLLNLLMMFVREKKKELIVLMINGYNRKSVRKYIYSDTIMLYVIGALIGTVLGILVAFMTLKFFATECITLMLHVDIPACLICIGATGILTAASVIIALKKINTFKLKDINEL